VIDVPSGNKEPLLLAIGIILGWGGSVINSEYGATTTGRKFAETAVRNIEKQQDVANLPIKEVKVVNEPEDPIPVEKPHT
jgi:hypothetical protein